MKNIGFVYNAAIRNNGTARRLWDTYVRMGGKEAGGKRYTRPSELGQHDLYLFVDDGRDDIPLDLPGPSAGWLIDTHVGWDARRQWADKLDVVFCAQKPAADAMSAEGLNAHWLPLACHPQLDPSAAEFRALPNTKEVVGPKGLDKQYDVAFVGFLPRKLAEGQNDRLEFLDQLFRRVPNFRYGSDAFFEQAALPYIRARCGVNYSIMDDLNMRFFEVQSYGTCLVTNRDAVGWADLGFEEWEHFVGFRGIDDAVDKIEFLVKNPCIRERIARRGHMFVRSAHTYGHRLEQIIRTVDQQPS